MERIKFEVLRNLYFDIDDIITEYKLNKNHSIEKVRKAVSNYVDGFGDSDYCLVDDEIIDKVTKKIIDKLNQ